MYFKYQALAALLLLLLSSCSPKEKPLYKEKLLGEIWNDMTQRNIRTIEILSNEVEERGRRKYDVEVVEKAEAIFEARENFELTLSPDPELLNQGFGQLKAYVTYLDSTRNANEYGRIKDWESHMDAIEYFHSKILEEFDLESALNISVHLAHLERELLGNFASEVGSTHGFGINFVFNPSNDSIKVGEAYELIIGPSEINASIVAQYDYHSNSLTLGNNPVDNFEVRTIGGAAYLKFTPESAGTYVFNTVFKSTFDYGEYVYEQGVTWNFKVLDK